MRQKARGGRGQGSIQIVINGMDVTNATHNFLDQEWQRLRGHYDFINQRREHANGRGRGGAHNPARGWQCSKGMRKEQ